MILTCASTSVAGLGALRLRYLHQPDLVLELRGPITQIRSGRNLQTNISKSGTNPTTSEFTTITPAL
jgi:hypothetical protein